MKEHPARRASRPVTRSRPVCQRRMPTSEDELDLAFVLGTGFAPFRGGPLRHARAVGLARVVDELRRAQDASDVRSRPGGRERFEPCALLLSLADR